MDGTHDSSIDQKLGLFRERMDVTNVHDVLVIPINIFRSVFSLCNQCQFRKSVPLFTKLVRDVTLRLRNQGRPLRRRVLSRLSRHDSDIAQAQTDRRRRKI